MIYLLFCIGCSSLLVFMFRVFDHYEIEAYPAIVANYLTCVCCGLIATGQSPSHLATTAIHADWRWLGVALGVAFIHVFVLTGITAVRFGVSAASVAMKLGLVIPVLLAFVLYHEEATAYKVAGIICALIAVLLSSHRDKIEHGPNKNGPAKSAKGISLLLPILVFVGSGLCDSGGQLGAKRYFPHGGADDFVIAVFACAALTGLIYLTVRVARGSISLHWRQLIGGIALGIPNYGSLLFLMRSLDRVEGGSSVVFPVVNIATVAGSTLLSVIFFREHLNRYNRFGLFFAGLCIVFIYMDKIVTVIGHS